MSDKIKGSIYLTEQGLKKILEEYCKESFPTEIITQITFIIDNNKLLGVDIAYIS